MPPVTICLQLDHIIEAACSTDSSRPVLTSVYVDTEAKMCVATDSYLLACVPYTRIDSSAEERAAEDDGPCRLVPGAAFAEARRAAKSSRLRGIFLELGDDGVVVKRRGSTVTYPYADGVFPGWRNLVPAPAGDPAARVGINPRLLLKVGTALGIGDMSPLALEIYHPMKAVLVRVPSRDDTTAPYGIVMPTRLSDQDRAPSEPDYRALLADQARMQRACAAYQQVLLRRKGKAAAVEAFRAALVAPPPAAVEP